MRFAVFVSALTDQLPPTVSASLGFPSRLNFEQNLNAPIGYNFDFNNPS
jgi:hypothetical protein